MHLFVNFIIIYYLLHSSRARGAMHAACAQPAACTPRYTLSIPLFLSLSLYALSLSLYIYSRGASESSACCDKGRWCKLILMSYISRFFVHTTFFLNKCFDHYFLQSRLKTRKKVTQYTCSS